MPISAPAVAWERRGIVKELDALPADSADAERDAQAVVDARWRQLQIWQQQQHEQRLQLKQDQVPLLTAQLASACCCDP